MSIADQAVNMGALWCTITGGEPLLRDDFKDIYIGLKKKGLLVSVFTNACLISQEHVDLFRRYPPEDMEVTVYGVTKETYEAVTRVPGSFRAFMKGLGLLQDGGLKVRLKAMALRSNVHELPLIAEFCRAHTVDYFRFDPFLHMRLDRNEERNELIRAERLSPEEIVALEISDQERYQSLEKGCNKLIMPELCHTKCSHLFHCGTGVGSFVLGYDGRIRLCMSLQHPDFTLDPEGCNLAKSYYSFVSKVRDMRSNDEAFLSTCRICAIKNLCTWCPAHAYLETGRIDGCIPYFCQVAHARERMLSSGASSGEASVKGYL